MASPAAQAYPRIRDAVESFVEDVQDFTEDAYEQLPTTTITESNTFRDRKHEYTVKQPSKIVRDTNRFKHFYFSDLAESLINDGLSSVRTDATISNKASTANASSNSRSSLSITPAP